MLNYILNKNIQNDLQKFKFPFLFRQKTFALSDSIFYSLKSENKNIQELNVLYWNLVHYDFSFNWYALYNETLEAVT
jgi:hypothetical protein